MAVDEALSFASFSHLIDARLLRAISDQGFAHPTPVQTKTIPLALESRDVLVRARTGSGKTVAYVLPLIQKILTAKLITDVSNNEDSVAAPRQTTRAMILVPTRELAEQVTSFTKSMLQYCEREITVVNIAAGGTTHLQRVILSDRPDIVIGTPSRALSLVQSKSLILADLETMVIDEADLILSYGHDADVRQIFSGNFLPRVFQSVLMSATMTEDVEMLKGLALKDPAILKFEDGDDLSSRLSQYVVKCSEVDKFLLTYVILKLKLIKGKCIIFVNDVDRSYRLKLFLEQFSIKSCVLNSELPLNSRYHTVQEFNKGVYDYVIATDESGTLEGDPDNEEKEDSIEVEHLESEEEDDPIPAQRESQPLQESSSILEKKRKRPTPPPLSRKKQKPESSTKKPKEKEYGVTRGVDFINVSCVLNFDLPTSARSYTHRIGRTARAGRTGMSLSYVIPEHEFGKNKVVGGVESTRKDEKVFARVEKAEKAKGSDVKEYKFDMKQVEAFRYRMEDALRSVTRKAVKEARIKELKSEILNSDKLKAHFEDNPLDLEYLRHDKPLHPTRIHPHMKHIPKYLLPRIAPVEGQAVDSGTAAVGVTDEKQTKHGFVPFRKEQKGKASRGRGRGQRGGARGGGRKRDPLKRFGK